MENTRYTLFCEIIEYFDEGIALSSEYDSMLHNYNGSILYQAESQMIKMIGNRPGITASEIAQYNKQTVSAVSQIIRKLKKKGWVEQRRNKENNRIWNLFLTGEGERIYLGHQKFENRCYLRSFESLSAFSEEEFKTYIRIQSKLNDTFRQDVEESRIFNYEYAGAKSDAT